VPEIIAERTAWIGSASDLLRAGADLAGDDGADANAAFVSDNRGLELGKFAHSLGPLIISRAVRFLETGAAEGPAPGCTAAYNDKRCHRPGDIDWGRDGD
jgi:hypothetical protein